MNSITSAFDHGKAFVAYLMGGDPNLEKTRDYILAMQEAGADLIEVGIPFSDPIAEGEVIQEANIRALSAGTTLDKLFDLLQGMQGEVRVPLAFLTYLNPVHHYGYERFFSRCRDCGIAGCIIPDLPFEERGELAGVAERFEVDIISLVAPTSQGRIAQIAAEAKGFVYLVSSMGVTGVRGEITTDISSMVETIRGSTDTPVAVGFGIATPQQAAAMSRQADGVIVGSAIVKLIAAHGTGADDALRGYVREMKAVLAPE